MGLGWVLRQRVREAREVLFARKLRFQQGRILGEVLTQALACAAMAVAFAQLIGHTLAGALSIGALVMSFQAFQRGTVSVQELVTALSQLYEHSLFMGRLTEFLALPVRIVDPPAARPFPARLETGIHFEGVAFRYPGSPGPVIEGLDLCLPAGQMAALVGENGAGKSTLVKLLCRLYDPTSGRITLDGADLRDFRRQELWSGMAVLFPGLRPVPRLGDQQHLVRRRRPAPRRRPGARGRARRRRGRVHPPAAGRLRPDARHLFRGRAGISAAANGSGSP